MRKQTNSYPSKKAILAKEKEDNWRIPPSLGIPKYTSQEDPFCPSGQMRKFNDEKRLTAKLISDNEQRKKQWTSSTLDSNFKDIPLKVSSFPTKGVIDVRRTVVNHQEYAEIEILQKIIVRENLLGELHKLVKSHYDLAANMGEIVDLVKALRYQTVDIVEDICAWQDVQSFAQPFLYKDLNYLVKIKCDLDFLDLHEQVVERFCFEFKSNPLAYRGGGSIITGYGGATRESYGQFMSSLDMGGVDDMEVHRLHAAEQVIQREFTRLSTERSSTHRRQNSNEHESSNANIRYESEHSAVSQQPRQPYEYFSNVRASAESLPKEERSTKGMAGSSSLVNVRSSSEPPFTDGSGVRVRGGQSKSNKVRSVGQGFNPKK